MPDPDAAAKRFMGLVIGPGLLPILLGIEQPRADEELDRDLTQAVACFLSTLHPSHKP